MDAFLIYDMDIAGSGVYGITWFAMSDALCAFITFPRDTPFVERIEFDDILHNMLHSTPRSTDTCVEN